MNKEQILEKISEKTGVAVEDVTKVANELQHILQEKMGDGIDGIKGKIAGMLNPEKGTQ